MRIPQRSQKLFMAVLASSLVLGFGLSAMAQVGPSAPQEKPPVDPAAAKIKDSFKKFFGSAPKEKVDEVNPNNNDNQQKFDGTAKTQSGTSTVKFTPDPRRPETWGDDPNKTMAQPKPKTAEKAAPPEAQAPAHPPLLTQPPLTNAHIDDPQIDANRPPKQTLRLDDAGNPLGYADAVNQIQKVDTLIREKRLTEARAVLLPLRQWLVDCTEAHISLYNTLNKLPSARTQAELEKQLALEFAMLRDRSMFELGLLYVEDKEYKKAVKELVEVIKSQPKSKVGILAYELLQEIGFTEKLQLDTSNSHPAAKSADKESRPDGGKE